ncbi:ABC transporter substrate-binding protein [Sediminicoccus sp. KRV36]|uniref:ABC transporter substrate-binding protein n=1 Tax=Sediminicoccus sp. KRV36 TaxID=3133721 RepID=UPI00200E2062|nr:ABC transporter substrate-binding protein [Sediminicoccus rosea]UPY39002.1 ABC transporter substrate-binding protein [Sediminicoccus rosea]
MKRRDLFASMGAASLAGPALAQPAQNRVLKFVPQANLTSLDPIWTTANITRNHGHMIYDSLYGVDANFQPQPQMAAGHVTEDGGRTIIITLRDGLKFHDGEPVRAQDVVPSLTRWMRRNPFGQQLAAATEAVEVVDDKRVRFRLKKPFPLIFAALAQVSNSPAFIMPERLARTDPFQQVREAIGSGPFRFKADEYNSGSKVVYTRNADYVPVSSGTPSLTAGPKIANFDRVEWNIIVDAATSAAALQTGEIDWYEQPPPEIQQLLRRNRNVKLEAIDPLPLTGILRFNHLHPPFDNKRLRQALLPAISQSDFMSAIVGTNTADYRADVGFFTPGTPLANNAAMGPLTGPRSMDRARALMREAGYTNQPMRLIGPTDILAPSAMTQVGADLVRRLGFNADILLTDWGTTVQRRTSREPVERGGWSMLFTSFSSFDFANPAAHFPLRGNGTNAWFGWPTVPRLEELRDAWFDATDLATEQRLAREMQEVAMDDLPYIPVGAYMSTTALRSNLVGRVAGLALFWGIGRA